MTPRKALIILAVAVGAMALPASASAGVGFHYCSQLSTGKVNCWGMNHRLQLGNTTGFDSTQFMNYSATPLEVQGLSNPASLGLGGNTNCAVFASGKVSCWGDNQESLVDPNSLERRISTPVEVAGISTAASVSVGVEAACALLTSGSVTCWGGLPHLVNASDGSKYLLWGFDQAPAEVDGISNAVGIDAAGAHACALLATGKIKCWWDNEFGELGDGTTTHSLTPVEVQGISNAVAVSLGYQYSCALLSTSKVNCWGSNGADWKGFGTLGNNSSSDSSAPVEVQGITDAIQINAGPEHACALLASGKVKCWGNNSSGQLGNGSTTESLVPVEMQGVSDAASVFAGFQFTCVTFKNGSVKCVGMNDFGALGNGTTTSSTSLVDVSGISSAVAAPTYTPTSSGGSTGGSGGSSGGSGGSGTPAAPGLPTITTKPKATTNAGQVTIAWTAGTGGTPTSYECKTLVNSAVESNWQACSSPVTLPSHKGSIDYFQVRGVAGSVKGSVSTVGWRSQDLNLTSVGAVTASNGFDVQNDNPELGTVLVAGAIAVTGSSGKGSIGYQWLKCSGSGMSWTTTSTTGCVNIAGATGATFRPTKAETGWFIRVQVTYTSDTHYAGNTYSSKVSGISAGWVQPPVGKIVTQPAFLYSGNLTFGKVIGYNIGTYSAGFAPCLADGSNSSSCFGGGVQTSLQYCETTNPSTCVDSYNLTTGNQENTAVKDALGRAKGPLRILEPAAIGKHLRLHTTVYYVNEDAPSILAVKHHYSPITTGTVAAPASTAAPTININPSSYTSQFGTQSVPKRGRTISSTFGSWTNVYNWSYWVHGSRLYDFYETRPFVYWYRCSSPTDETTCVDVNRKVPWRTDGSGFLTYTPDTDDVGNYIRSRAAYSVCYTVAQYSGDCPYWWSNYSTATAKVVRN